MIKNIAIVIPAYKPSEKLVDLVIGLRKEFEHVVIVDDGSGPDYRELFKKLNRYGATLLIHNINFGKGRALKTGLNYCISIADEVVGAVTVDADGQHELQDIMKTAEMVSRSQKALVLGCRDFSGKNIPFRSRLGNKFSRIVYKWLCNICVSDTQTGLRGIPRSFWGSACLVEGEKYEYETNMLLKAKENGLEFAEVPIKTIYENNNETSHFNPIKDSIRIYKVIIKYSMSSLCSVFTDYIIFSIVVGKIGVLYATFLGRLFSAFANFAINRNLVFKYKGNIFIQMFKYASLVIASGSISALGILAITHVTNYNNPIIIKIIMEVILYFLNYYVQSVFIFSADDSSKRN